MNNRHRAPLALALAVLLILTACSSSQVVSNLQIALDAITVALPVLGGLTGVPPATVAAATTYVAQANQALGQASTILAGPGTDAQKSLQIFAAFAGIAKPDIPTQYGALVSIVATVAQEVGKFLESLPAAPAAPGKATATAPHITVVSSGDAAKLEHAREQAAANAAAIAKMR